MCKIEHLRIASRIARHPGAGHGSLDAPVSSLHVVFVYGLSYPVDV